MKTTACSLLLAGLMAAAGAQAQTAAPTTPVPVDAGEASTMVQGRPNADVNAPTLGKSRAEVRAERELDKAQKQADKNLLVMGNASARAGEGPGTPPTAPAGTPSVFEGGTPK